MELRKALAQIEEVHAQVARTEVFEGYRARTVGLTGVLALIGAAAWPWVRQLGEGALSWQVLGLTGPVAGEWLLFLLWWGVIASVCIGIAAADVLGRRASPKEERRRQLVVMQFAPVIFVGAGLWIVLAASDGLLPWLFDSRAEAPGLVYLLPGVAAILNGMGILASRPYLPRAVGFAGLAYVCAGFVLIAMQHGSPVPAGWGMGLTFGLGQLFLAFVLYLNLERNRG